MSFVRNPTAERQRRQGADQIESRTLLGKQPFAQRVQHRPRRGRQWHVKGAALAFSWGRAGVVLFRKENHPCEKPRVARQNSGSPCEKRRPRRRIFKKFCPCCTRAGDKRPRVPHSRKRFAKSVPGKESHAGKQNERRRARRTHKRNRPARRRKSPAPRRSPPSARTQATTAARRPTSNTSGNTTSRTTFRSPRRRSTGRWTPSGARA